MRFSCRMRGSITIVTLDEPRFVAAEVACFKRSLKALVDQGADYIILNLSTVEFMDSAGLGSLVSHLKYTGEGRKFYLAGLTGSVEKMFRLTHMDTFFTIYANVEAGLAAAPAEALRPLPPSDLVQ